MALSHNTNTLDHSSPLAPEPSTNNQKKERLELAQVAARALLNTEYRHRSEAMSICGRGRVLNGRLTGFLCQQMGCPHCYGRRIGRIRNPLLDRVAGLEFSPDWYLLPVVLSVKSLHSSQLGQAFDILSDGCKGLGRRKPFSQALGTVSSKEFTVQGDEIHPHAHNLYLFKSRAEAEQAAETVGPFFRHAAQLPYNPYIHVADPVPGSDIGSILRLCGYATKLPEVETFRQLVQDPDRYRDVYRALNGRRPGRDRNQLVTMTGVFSPRTRVTAEKLAAMPMQSARPN